MYHSLIPTRHNTPTRKAPEQYLTLENRWKPEQYYKDSALLPPSVLRKMIFKRNKIYDAWLTHWMLPRRNPRWQPVRVLDWKDSDHEYTRDCWFKLFVEGLFFVYENPITIKEPNTKKPYQYYILAPEHGYEVNVSLDIRANRIVPRRKPGLETFMSKHQHLTTPRIVPVEVCHHYTRHERVGGAIPDLAVDGADPTAMQEAKLIK
jgi:hypothetical protein